MENYLNARQVRGILSGAVPEPVVKGSQWDREKRAGEAAIAMCFGRTFAEKLSFLHQLTLNAKHHFKAEDNEQEGLIF